MAAVPWHQFACAEAVVDDAKSTLANTDASEAGSERARAVLVRSDRMLDNGIVRVDAGFVVLIAYNTTIDLNLWIYRPCH